MNIIKALRSLGIAVLVISVLLGFAILAHFYPYVTIGLVVIFLTFMIYHSYE